MDRREPPFKYRLAALLKVDQWEGRLLGAELKRARIVLEERQRLHRETLQRIERAETEMRELHRDDREIPLERRRLLSDYLNEQYAESKSRQTDATNAEKAFDRIVAQRQAKQQQIRALEHHEDRERREHEAEQTRLGFRDADEMWLNMRGSKGNR